MCPAGLDCDANIYALDLLPWFSAILRNSHHRWMNFLYLMFCASTVLVASGVTCRGAAQSSNAI